MKSAKAVISIGILTLFLSAFILGYNFSPMVHAQIVSDLNDLSSNADELLTDPNDEIPLEVLQAMKDEEEPSNAYQKLWDDFYDETSKELIYPANYGGEYIDGDKLVILLTDVSEESKQYYRDICDSNCLVFQEAEYSLNYLQNLEQNVLNLINNGVKISSYGIDNKNNSYSVELSNKDTTFLPMYAANRISTSSLPIQYSFGKNIEACATSMYGGYSLTNESTNGQMSAGICGTYNGKKALLTCGHDNENSPYIKYGSIRIGRITYTRANLSPNNNTTASLGDFSIIELNSNATTTNRLLGGYKVTGSQSLTVGKTVYKYGAATGQSWGQISAVNQTVSYSGSIWNYTTRGLAKSTMTSSSGASIANGDSGAPVFIKKASSYDQVNIAGIVTARQFGSSVMYTTPITYPKDAGFSPKTS